MSRKSERNVGLVQANPETRDPEGCGSVVNEKCADVVMVDRGQHEDGIQRGSGYL